MSVFSDSSFVVKIVNAIATGKLSGKTHQLAHADLLHILQQCWNPLFHHIHKVKSHRKKEDAENLNDLYTILGNDLADEVAKEVNSRDLPALLHATLVISEHSKQQIDSLFSVYLYLAELNSLHSQLKLQKEHPVGSQQANASVDEYANFHAILSNWSIGDNPWSFDSDLPEVVAQACPAGAHIAFNVWHLFRKFKWRDPSLPRQDSDFGITWFELAICYAVNFGSFLPLWIYNGTKKRAVPVAFDSSEAKVQKPEARSIWHQANNLRAVVRYLENTLQCQIFPRYKKTGASSLVRLGYHPRLVGGISSRPEVPHATLLMENLAHYSSIAHQPSPLNVRLERPLISQGPSRVASPFTSISFDEGQKLYQKVKKCLRSKQSFATISFSL